MSKELSQIPPLDFVVHSDGSIDLEQNYSGNVDRVLLHACHVRYLFELTGHLLLPPSANELSKRLARQLCEVRMEMADLYGDAIHGLDGLYERLDAYCESLPDSVFPFDLYPCPDPKSQRRATGSEHPPFELQPSPK